MTAHRRVARRTGRGFDITMSSVASPVSKRGSFLRARFICVVSCSILEPNSFLHATHSALNTRCQQGRIRRECPAVVMSIMCRQHGSQTLSRSRRALRCCTISSYASRTDSLLVQAHHARPARLIVEGYCYI